MRAALYTRFSSDRQNPRSCDDQERALRGYAAGQGWTVSATYRDEAKSGTDTTARDGWRRLLADAPTRAWEVVLVEDGDRWSRDFFDGLNGLRQLRALGIRFASSSRGVLDLDTFEGQLLVAFDQAASAEVSRKISIHTLRGMEARIGHVSKNGGPAPYGYRRQVEVNPNGDRVATRLEVDPDTAPIVREMFQWRLAKLGLRSIGKRLVGRGIPSPRGGSTWHIATIRSLLQNPAYVGDTLASVWKPVRAQDGRKSKRKQGTGRLIPNTHPPVVPRELFEQVQATFRELQAKPTRRGKYPLSGLIRCGSCEERFYQHDARRTFRCRSHRRDIAGLPPCPNTARVSGQVLLGWVTEWLEDPDETGAAWAVEQYLARAQQQEDTEARVRRARSTLTRAETRAENLVEAIAEGEPHKLLLEALEAADGAILRAQEELAQARQAAVDPQEAADQIRAKSTAWWLQRDHLQTLVDRVTVYETGRVEVVTTVGRLLALGPRRPGASAAGASQQVVLGAGSVLLRRHTTSESPS